jgi:hypothetical protein
MIYWSTRRKISLAVHSLLAALLLVWSLNASVAFWQSLYADVVFAYGTVAVIDCIALLGMALHIARVQSPLRWLRHLLPFVSALPLWSELFAQFGHLGARSRYALTAFVTAVLVGLAWLAWHTIERLFVDPVEAAGERMQEQLEIVRTTMRQLHDAHTRVHSFAAEYITVQPIPPQTASQAALPQLEDASPAVSEADSIIQWRERDGMSFEEIGGRLGITRQSATARYNRAKARS